MNLKFVASMASGLVLSLCLALPALAEMGTLRGSAGGQINVRSQPSTNAPAPSYGLPGDRVQIIEANRGADGYLWYYVEFPKSQTRGWVRGDLLITDSDRGRSVQRIAFAPGATSATVNGSIQGYETRDYLLRAQAGQQMTVNLRSNSSFTQVVVFSPKEETLFVGTNWTGTLPSSGDYKVRVLLVRAEARRNGAGSFQVAVGIR